jgi:hypothetical protein
MEDLCTFDCLQFAAASKACKNPPPHWGIVATCAFRMPVPYKDNSKYSDGILRLARAITLYLPPGVLLRVFVDSSIDKQGLETEDAGWTKAITQLEKMRHVQLVRFTCPDYSDASNNQGHIGVFGTMMRYVSVLEDTSLPSWIVAPPGMPVCMTDVDFSNTYTTIAILLNLVAMKGKHGPDVACMVPAMSFQTRHQLSAPGLPAAMWAGAVTMKNRIPQRTLLDFLEGIKQGKTFLTGLEDSVTRIPTFDFGFPTGGTDSSDSSSNLGTRDGLQGFTYGVDEFFLTWVVRTQWLLSKEPIRISYIVMPIISSLYLFILFTLLDSSRTAGTDFNSARTLTADLCSLTDNMPPSTSVLEAADGDALVSVFAPALGDKKTVPTIPIDVSPMDYFHVRFPHGDAVEAYYTRVRNFLASYTAAVCDGRIKGSYPILQAVLQTLQFLPTGGRVFQTRSWKLGQGSVAEAEETLLLHTLDKYRGPPSYKKIQGTRKGSSRPRRKTRRG